MHGKIIDQLIELYKMRWNHRCLLSIKESNQTHDMMIRLLAILFFFTSSAFAKPLQLKDGDVVAFLGGTDLVRAQKDGALEAAITHRFKDLNIKFRDLAWEGDTVFFSKYSP